MQDYMQVHTTYVSDLSISGVSYLRVVLAAIPHGHLETPEYMGKRHYVEFIRRNHTYSINILYVSINMTYA